jgi:hypothetical protein
MEALETTKNITDDYNEQSGFSVFLDAMKASVQLETRLLKDDLSQCDMIEKPFLIAMVGVSIPLEAVFTGFDKLAEHKRTIEMFKDAGNMSGGNSEFHSKPPVPPNLGSGI